MVVYAALRSRLRPERTGGVSFDALAKELHRLGLPARYGAGHQLDAIVPLARRGALVLGVRPAVLYVGAHPHAKHAVYVSEVETPLDDLPEVVPGWRPSLRFVPPVEIMDPEPDAPERHTWTFEMLREAFLGEWVWIPDPLEPEARMQLRGKRPRSRLGLAAGVGALGLLALLALGASQSRR